MKLKLTTKMNRMRSFFFLLFTSFVITGASGQTISDKLEAYFSFDNCKGVDDSGNGSAAALKGNIACDCGIQDSAMRFADNNDALNFVGPLSDIFTTSDFTISFYIRPPDGQNQVNSQVVMAKQDTCNLSRSFWVRYVPKFNRISAGISENDTLFVTLNAKLDNNPCWQFITLTRSNLNFSLFVNGTLRDSRNSKARINLTNTSPLRVGEPVCPLDIPFKGMFDELRFHSRALNEEDLTRYYRKPDQILNRDTVVYLGNSVQISLGDFCADSYTWIPSTGVSDPNSRTPTITPVDSTYYSVAIEYADGCLAVDSIYVKAIDPKTLDCENVFLPNAFTPGGTENLNDRFGISNPFIVNDFISLEVFDRWGGRLFNAQDPFDTWDGTANGQTVNQGVYLYRLRYKCNGVEKSQSGNLTLIR